MALRQAAGPQASQNDVHDNVTGIQLDDEYYWGPASASDNRVYHNSGDRNCRTGDGNVRTIRSIHSIDCRSGIFSQYYNAQIVNNLVYVNSNEGIELNSALSSTQVTNNTVYQPVGDALLIQGGSSNVHLRNNILWVAAGYDLNVNADSENGFNSDYNLFYIGNLLTSGTDPNAHVGLWNGGGSNTVVNSLGIWQASLWRGRRFSLRRPAFRQSGGCRQCAGLFHPGRRIQRRRRRQFPIAGRLPGHRRRGQLDSPPTDILGQFPGRRPRHAELGQGTELRCVHDSQSVFSGTPNDVAQGWHAL